MSKNNVNPKQGKSVKERLQGLASLPFSKAQLRSQSVDGHGYVNPLSLDWDLLQDHTKQKNVPSGKIKDLQTNVTNEKMDFSIALDFHKSEIKNVPDSPVVEKRRVGRIIQQPKGTIEYTASSSDSIESIAARFDTIPSELVKLNRLPTRMIFPGQMLYVPDKDAIPEEPPSSKSPAITKTQETKKKENGSSPSSPNSPTQEPPLPGHVERINSDDLSPSKDRRLRHISEEEAKKLDEECYERFLKLSVKHITDGQGVVNGVLLVTPNAIMFDPSVSETLVKEHGSDVYGVIAPMENIISVAMYHDIATMRLKDAPQKDIPMPKVYHAKNCPLFKPKDSTTEENPKQEEEAGTSPQNITITEDRQPEDDDEKDHLGTILSQISEGGDSTCSCGEAKQSHSMESLDDLVFDEKMKDEVVETEGNKEEPFHRIQKDILGEISREMKESGEIVNNKPVPKENESKSVCNDNLIMESVIEREERDSFLEIDSVLKTQNGSDLVFHRSQVNTKPLNSQMSINTFFSSEKSTNKFQKQLTFPQTANETFSQPGGKSPNDKSPKAPSNGAAARRKLLGYKSIISEEEKPELFQAIDDIVIRPAKPYTDLPLYLCLKIGRPFNKKTTSMPMSFGNKKMKPEYWFCIPRERVDHLYAFFIHWSPNLYGHEDTSDPRERGFVLFDSEEEVLEEGMDVMEDYYKDDTRKITKDWEIVTVQEAKRRYSLLEMEENLPIPDLIGPTEILTDEHRKLLAKHLPARAEGYAWTLMYSTSQHGFSLKTMYRCMIDYETPILLVVTDTDSNVFGAMTSCILKISEHFYGSGESFLFTFYPEYKVFPWSGDNVFYIKGNAESLAIGAGDGFFGLWLDGDFYHGRSQPCKTYDNDTLTSKEDFVIKAIEAWGFIESS